MQIQNIKKTLRNLKKERMAIKHTNHFTVQPLLNQVHKGHNLIKNDKQGYDN